MGRALAASIFVFCLCEAALAADLDLARQLTTRYKDQILSLRHPLISQHQNYGLEGEPLTGAAEGPWTLYGRLRIEKIVVDGNELHAKATRVLCLFGKTGLQQMPDKERVTVSVRLAHAPASEDEAIAILDHVFALTLKDIVKSAPDYWQEYLGRNLFGPVYVDERRVTAAVPPKDQSGDRPESIAPTAAVAKNETAAKDTVYHLGEANLVAPRVQYAPEPDFTLAARQRRYQGVVGLNAIIDKTGTIENPKIVHPLGLGLDENAIAAVRRWRFTPAMRNGQPVDMAIYIEVDFHWY